MFAFAQRIFLAIVMFPGVVAFARGHDGQESILARSPDFDGSSDEKTPPLDQIASIVIDDVTATLETDTDVELVQLTAPIRQTPRRNQRDRSRVAAPAPRAVPLLSQRDPERRRRAVSLATSLGLSSIPYMIGDTGAGTCLSFRQLLDADFSHPTLTCSRLNVAENNSAVPVNRTYYSYRHFHNVPGPRVGEFGADYNVDRHTIGLERAFFDQRCSLELRIPIERRLNSEVASLIAPNFGIFDPVFAFPENNVELANISLVPKMVVMQREHAILTAGLGVTLPTAQDVNYRIGADNLVSFDDPGLTSRNLATFTNHFKNETVYLAPFLAWLVDRNARWFHQGFLQVEMAANPSNLLIEGDGTADFFRGGAQVGLSIYTVRPGTVVPVIPQALLRVNLGFGCRLLHSQNRKYLNDLSALFELHYTGTLHDSALAQVPIDEIFFGADTASQQVFVGNGDRRTDILNTVLGLSAQIGKTRVTNGFAAPLRNEPDRGFDFEYNLIVQRVF